MVDNVKGIEGWIAQSQSKQTWEVDSNCIQYQTQKRFKCGCVLVDILGQTLSRTLFNNKY